MSGERLKKQLSKQQHEHSLRQHSCPGSSQAGLSPCPRGRSPPTCQRLPRRASHEPGMLAKPRATGNAGRGEGNATSKRGRQRGRAKARASQASAPGGPDAATSALLPTSPTDARSKPKCRPVGASGEGEAPSGEEESLGGHTAILPDEERQQDVPMDGDAAEQRGHPSTEQRGAPGRRILCHNCVTARCPTLPCPAWCRGAKKWLCYSCYADHHPSSTCPPWCQNAAKDQANPRHCGPAGNQEGDTEADQSACLHWAQGRCEHDHCSYKNAHSAEIGMDSENGTGPEGSHPTRDG